MKRMSTATHGVIDYVFSAVIALLPRFGGYSKRVTTILETAAGTAAVYSSMTNYERGLIKVLPMKAHLTLDALSGGALIGAALVLNDEPDDVRITLAGIGLFEVFAAISTQTRSPGDLAKQHRTTTFAPRGNVTRSRDQRGRFIPQHQNQRA